MKRIRIWLNSFTLLQQFITLVILTVTVFVFFIITFLNRNIEMFVNNQMYDYLHKEQLSFITSGADYSGYLDSNVEHIVYSRNTNSFISSISESEEIILRSVPLEIEGDVYDGMVSYNGETVLYSVKNYSDNRYILISLVSGVYRNQFRAQLVEMVFKVALLVILCLFSFFMIWVLFLITPLKQIRSYIDKVKEGDEVQLNIYRHDEIGEVAEALVNMNDELARQERIREEMIQNISHDLKTPIATIKSYGESIKDGIYPYDTLEKSVDVIIEHADRLEQKVYRLITFNKLGYLADSEPGENLDMPKVIQKAILSCKVLRNDVNIDADIDEKVKFHGEEEPWRVVVENLIDNALRYAKTYVRIKLSEGMLEVYNDGENMSKERIEKLFKPYEKGTKGNFGLGLSIVKKVAETYGYNVLGENTDDGVVFSVYQVRKQKKTRKKKEEK